MCGKKGISFVENGILPLVPPLRGRPDAVGVVASLQFYRKICIGMYNGQCTMDNEGIFLRKMIFILS